jgi:hypothetical protein
MNIISNGYRFRRGTGSPFDSLVKPEHDMSVARDGVPCKWCPTCKQGVDTKIITPNQAQVFGFKETCLRCGAVLMSAVYYHVQSLSEQPTTLVNKALLWLNERECITK